MRKISALLSVSLLLLCSCGDDIKEEELVIPVSSVLVNPSTASLTIGDTAQLEARVSPTNATDAAVIWSSSSAAIATVSSTGIVTAIGEGDAIVTAKAGGKTGSCTVTVKKRVVAVTSITLDKTQLTLEEGESETLTATVKPDDATDKTVTWTSSNDSVATVSDGVVTAKSEGKTTITAKSGEKSVTCAVSVSKKFVAVTSIELNKTELSLVKGLSESLIATIKPDDATNKTVTWSSSNSSIAQVDQNGNVTAKDGGTAIIKAMIGDVSASCNVTVTVPVESISLNKTTLSLIKGESEDLVATVSPSDATDKKVTWSSSDASVAEVNQSGRVYAKDGGTVTITAKAGDKSASCIVTVTVPVSGITLNKTSITLVKGQSEVLIATILPENASDKSVTWSTSDSSIADVNQSGGVTAVDGGTATITVKAGDKEASCIVTVTIPVDGISLNKTNLTLNKGQSETLIATVSPDDATDKTVTWSSANENVAIVDQNGQVTAVADGTVTITAKSGSMSASCTVTVITPVESITLSITAKTIKINETVQLSAEVSPSDATNKTINWTSSDESIASVSSNGLVKGLKEGIATITASADNQSAMCIITVKRSTAGGNEGIGYDE